MRLSDLLGAPHPNGALEITGLTADSRRVEPGFLFAALRGAKTDGAAFIADAAANGAVAILAPPGTAAPSSVALV
ncbi:MAG: Mur ligase domain-containing protein, partial [Pseudomonadota bacterium]